MEFHKNLPFNPKESTKMHIDINSCFATVEQQANPTLRHKPVGVAPYTGNTGTIIAASIEAKLLGIKTGCKVKEAKLLCPNITILEPDPQKYRYVHLKLKNLLLEYTKEVVPKSIDEFILNLEGYPAYKRGMFVIAQEIKNRIKKEIGDYITVSIGIAPNRFLAKTASNLIKPNGLEEINKNNYLEVFSKLELTDLCGIKKGFSTRLGNAGIYTLMDFYNAEPHKVKYAFESKIGYDWYLRLRGWEADDVEFGRKSYGNSYALPKPFFKLEDLTPILFKLSEKTGSRMRKSGFKAKGIHVSILYRDGTHWHKGYLVEKPFFDTRDIYKHAYNILRKSPYKKPVRILAESCFGLTKSYNFQLDMFEDINRKSKFVEAVDGINEKFGDFVITPAKMLSSKEDAPDRISFGGVKELEDFVIG